MDRRADQGFSLIELLTVVIILGVLAAIALPVLGAQKSKALRSAAESDLRSLKTAQLAWLAHEDHDTPTDDLAELEQAGYNPTDGVTASVVVDGQTWTLCVKHVSLEDWLVYDSQSGQTSSSAADACA